MISHPELTDQHAAALAEMRAALSMPAPEVTWWAKLKHNERAILAQSAGCPEVADLDQWHGIRADKRGDILFVARRWAQWARTRCIPGGECESRPT